MRTKMSFDMTPLGAIDGRRVGLRLMKEGARLHMSRTANDEKWEAEVARLTGRKTRMSNRWLARPVRRSGTM